MTDTQTADPRSAIENPKPKKRKRMRPIELWQLREQRKADGVCVDCGGPVAMKLDNTPSVRCKDHLKGNTGNRSRTSDQEKAAQKAEEDCGGHLDSISFVDYCETMYLAIAAATPNPAGGTALSALDGATYRMIHEELGPLARPDWTIDGLRVLKTAGRIREGSSILITRWLALHGAAPAYLDPAEQLDSKDEYDELLAYAQQPSSYAEVAYA